MDPDYFSPEGERVISVIFEVDEMEELLHQDPDDSVFDEDHRKIDYEKMARQLADTLQSKEREWRRLRSDYENYIVSLQIDRNLARPEIPQLGAPQMLSKPTQHAVGPWQKTISGPVEEALKNQTKALLLTELISMELYYGMEDLLRDGGGSSVPGLGQEVSTEKLYALTDRDLLLHSAETLLELTEYFFTKSTLCSGENTETSKGVAAVGGPPSPFGSVFPDPSYTGKLLRVRGTLGRIKETTDGAAVKFLSSILEAKESPASDKDRHKRQLQQLLKDYIKSSLSQQDCEKQAHDLAEVLNLEQTLCHVLMDKALVNCLLLLDKAEMERRVKQLKEEQARYDFAAVDPVLMKYRKKSSEDNSQRGDGRLISVDEGVVLEGSESTNSREKLSAPLESSSLADMEAENRTLCENNARMRRKLEDSEKSNEFLAHRLQELQDKLTQTEMNHSELLEYCKSAQSELQARFNDSEFERDELNLKMKEQQDQLREFEVKCSTLSEAEENTRFQVSGELCDKLEKVKTENDALTTQVTILEEKLALYSDSNNNPLLKMSDAAPNRARYEESKRKDEQDYELRIKNLLEENARLLEESAQLRARLSQFEKEVAKVKEDERRIREDLCDKMAAKLTSAQTHSEELGVKIMELESKLQNAESCFLKQIEIEKTEKKLVCDDIEELKHKLATAEAQNSFFCLNVREVEKKLNEVGKVLATKKNNEVSLQRRVDELESENRELRENKTSNTMAESIEGAVVEPQENSELCEENQILKESIVGLEAQILLKDQEILSLKNEVVDLMAEVSKLDGEYNEVSSHRVRLEKELKDHRAAKDEVESELQHILKECAQLKQDGAEFMEENKILRERMESNSKIIKESVTAVLNERGALEHGLVALQRREKDLEGTLSNSEILNKKLELEINNRENTISQLQSDLDALLSEKSKLQFSVGELKDKNLNTAEENGTLQHDLGKLERNLSTLQESLTVCLREKGELAQEMSVKSAEVDTLRTYASLCSEEVRSMQSQIELYKETEEMLESRVEELEESVSAVTNESLSMKSDMNTIEEERKGLEKRIQEASRAIDRVKTELLTLMQTVLALQKELLCIVDSILTCLGLDTHHLQGTGLRFVSNDSGYMSNNTETCSERSSESSDANFTSALTSSYLVPDEGCLVNPSEISVIRENKSEIFRMHEELKIKLLIIKDAVDRCKDNRNDLSSSDMKAHDSNEAISKSSIEQVKDFPYLNKAERVELTNLLSILKREGSSSKGEEVYDSYSKLEGKLSGLSSQLASKEIEICRLLKEKILLHDELLKSRYGISLCEHCLNDPEKLEESNELLRSNLLTYMEDTARLEADIVDFAEYKAKLEKELEAVREQITELEDELGAGNMMGCHGNIPVVTITPDSPDVERNQTPERKTSDSSLTASTISCTDSNEEPKEKRNRSEKHVTFEQTDGENPTQILRKHRQEDKASVDSDSGLTKGVQPEMKMRKLEESQDEWEGSDIDLCELLESIPLKLPTVVTKEDKEMEVYINRLSEYDNLDYKDKLEMFVRQNSEEKSEAVPSSPQSEADGRMNPDMRRSVDETNCKMCGLLRKKKKAKRKEDSYKKASR